MFRQSVIAAMFTGLIMLSMNTNAALIDITATSIDSRFTDFTLRFDDLSGDGLLQIDEVVEFSGFTLTNPQNSSLNGFYSVITGTAEISNISTSSGVPLFAASNWNIKRFQSDLALCCSSNFWIYSSVALTATPSMSSG